ncbi:class I tRNA ligase family protein [Bacillus cereus]|nr:class I tRNA ligase family protein [Bacillus cereus]
MKTFIVTATPPTTNGDLHIGHLSGPYLAADVFSRFQKMKGNNVIYSTSGDDHQTYIATTAKRKGWTPEKLVEYYTKKVQDTLGAAFINLNIFSNSLNNQEHIKFVQSIFKKLYNKGVFVEKQKEIHFCNNCDQYLFESFIKGECPFCNEKASGNLCEACGRINDPIELINPVCGLCGETPTISSYKGMFFPLENYRDQLVEYYNSRVSWRPHLKELCNWIVSKPIPDYPVTYPTKWGIPVPIKGYTNQCINVWFEMYPGHIATTNKWLQLNDSNFSVENLCENNATLVQFLGYDNSFFNAVLHVATCFAIDEGYLLPEHIITNEFYLLEHAKFSTSREHAIWGSDLLKEVPADSLRYYVCRTNPEHTQTNFSLKDFNQIRKNELEDTWFNTISTFIEIIKETSMDLSLFNDFIDLKAKATVSWAKKSLESFYDINHFSLRQASQVLHEYLQICKDYLDTQVIPVKDINMKIYLQRLASLGYMIQALIYFAQPILPSFSMTLKEALGVDVSSNQNLNWENIEKIKFDNTNINVVKNWFCETKKVML